MSYYVATAGGMGPGTIEALGQLLDALGGEPADMLVAATDTAATPRSPAAPRRPAARRREG